MKEFNKRMKQHQDETERLRKIKIEIRDKRRNKAINKVKKKEAEIEMIAYQQGYKVRVKELLKRSEVR